MELPLRFKKPLKSTTIDATRRDWKRPQKEATLSSKSLVSNGAG
jgi:hypothetical protein